MLLKSAATLEDWKFMVAVATPLVVLRAALKLKPEPGPVGSEMLTNSPSWVNFKWVVCAIMATGKSTVMESMRSRFILHSPCWIFLGYLGEQRLLLLGRFDVEGGAGLSLTAAEIATSNLIEP